MMNGAPKHAFTGTTAEITAKFSGRTGSLFIPPMQNREKTGARFAGMPRLLDPIGRNVHIAIRSGEGYRKSRIRIFVVKRKSLPC